MNRRISSATSGQPQQKQKQWQDISQRAGVADRSAVCDALMHAIRTDQLGDVESLVRNGVPLSACYPRSIPPDVKFENPVDWAALELRFSSAMKILESSDDLCAGEENRKQNVPHPISVAMQTRHAVGVAARYGHLGLLRMLLDRSACIGQSSVQEESPLHAAVLCGHRDVVALLLNQGAWEVETQQSEVSRLASARNLDRLFEIATGDSTATCDGDSRDLLTYVSEGASQVAFPDSPTSGVPDSPASANQVHPPNVATRRIAWLQEGASGAVWQEEKGTTEGISSWGWSPPESLPITPMAAASGGAVAFSRPGTARPDSTISSPRTLRSGDVRLRGELNRAIRKGDVDKLHALVGRGAPLDAKFDLGYGEEGTCVDWACVTGHEESAITLLKLADEQGMGNSLASASFPALYWAVSQSFLGLLKELLNRGADAGVVQRHGSNERSLLSHAIYSMRARETVELLRHSTWEKEPLEEQEHMLAWMQSQKQMIEIFKTAGIERAGDPVVVANLPDFQEAELVQEDESKDKEAEDVNLTVGLASSGQNS